MKAGYPPSQCALDCPSAGLNSCVMVRGRMGVLQNLPGDQKNRQEYQSQQEKPIYYKCARHFKGTGAGLRESVFLQILSRNMKEAFPFIPFWVSLSPKFGIRLPDLS